MTGDEVELCAPLIGRMEARRILLRHLVAKDGGDHMLWWVAHRTPGLLVLEDFSWLLGNACDASRTMVERENYAELARMLPIHESREAVEAWLPLREHEPVKSKLDYPLSIQLDSDEARRAKKNHAGRVRGLVPPRKKRIKPLPDDRVRRMLVLAETKDPKFFFNLCQELTLTEDSTHYQFQRFLTRTPGWNAAEPRTRESWPRPSGC